MTKSIGKKKRREQVILPCGGHNLKDFVILPKTQTKIKEKAECCHKKVVKNIEKEHPLTI